MMEGDQNKSPSMEFAGTENDLNHIWSTFVDSEDEINTTLLRYLQRVTNIGG